ncbi:MAG: flagellar basal body rod protein FlgB [Thiogranum sp.]|nr:flagellar basal body rod protein FlgB [Thiogranum sp.]
MAISMDKALGNLPDHLSVYGKRSTLLASNIANADTPGFKARDVDFRAAFEKASGNQLSLTTTSGKHVKGTIAGAAAGPLYRVPNQPSLDGNTVDTQIEQAEFAENAVRYQATLTFLNSKFNGLKLAIKGQ